MCQNASDLALGLVHHICLPCLKYRFLYGREHHRMLGVAGVQVSGTLISSNGQSDPEPLAVNAASAAVSASDIPWMGEALPPRTGCSTPGSM